MRKVTKQIAQAFMAGKAKTAGNTSTDGQSVFLHGNRIAWKDGDYLALTLAGWGTNTTRERLNSILDEFCEGYIPLKFSQRNHEQFFGDIVISSDETILINPETGVFQVNR